MNINDYLKEALRTFPDLGSKEQNTAHMYMGVITEAGELFDLRKKQLAYGKEFDVTRIKDELGDLMWYLVVGAYVSDNYETYDFRAMSEIFAQYVVDSAEQEPWEIFNTFFCSYISSNFYSWEELFVILQLFAERFELQLDSIMDANIAKLKVRFPEKFSGEQAINKNVEEEQKVFKS